MTVLDPNRSPGLAQSSRSHLYH